MERRRMVVMVVDMGPRWVMRGRLVEVRLRCVTTGN